MLTECEESATLRNLPNSTSWSGPIQTCSRNKQKPAQPIEEVHNPPKRSWARSKRISLGCLDWRSTSTSGDYDRQSNRPYSITKSKNANTPTPSIYPTTDTSTEHPSGSKTNEMSNKTCHNSTVPSGVCRASGGTAASQVKRARSGADALLRRLRVRSLVKASSKSDGGLERIPRSASTPRTLGLGDGEWQRGDGMGEDAVRQTGASSLHGGWEGNARSVLSLKSAPEMTESMLQTLSSLAADFEEPGRKSAGYAEMMSRSFVPFTSDNPYAPNDQPHPPFYNYPQWVNECSCLGKPQWSAGEMEPSMTHAPGPLYKPLSQPEYVDQSYARSPCAFNRPLPQAGRHMNSNPTQQFTRARPPMVQCCGDASAPGQLLADIPPPVSSPPQPFNGYNACQWAFTQPSMEGGYNAGKPVKLLQNGMPAYDQNRLNLTHHPHHLKVGENPRTMRTTLSSYDLSTMPAQQTRPLPPTYNVCTHCQCETVHSVQNNPSRPVNPSQPSQMPPPHTKGQSDVTPNFQGHVPMQNTKSAFQTASIRVTKPNGVGLRPDSLLSGSSLTAESSFSDSMPNSSSSRDSAIGGALTRDDRDAEVGESNGKRCSTLESHDPQRLAQQRHFERMTWSSKPATTAIPPSHSQVPRSRYVLSDRPYPPPITVPSTHRVPMPPTPQRQSWLFQPDPLQSRSNSQRIRAERKQSTYVNSSNYPTRKQATVDTRDSNATSQVSQPSPWAQLLPYRTSTVPPNLCERLRKSETLPNDVWLHTQQTSKEKNAAMCSSIAPESGMRSPPPRPPMRTTSQKQINHPIIQRTEILEKSVVIGRQHGADRTQPPPVANHRASTRKVYENPPDNSPVLCRYSQLYALPGMAMNGRTNLPTSQQPTTLVINTTNHESNASFRSQFEQMHISKQSSNHGDTNHLVS